MFIKMKPVYALLLFLIFSCKKQDNFINPSVKKVTEAVYASGYIAPENEYKLVSRAEGYLTKKLVNEGDEIKVGQELFIIESDQQNYRLRSSKAVLDIAEQNISENGPVLSEISSGLLAVRKKLSFDSINYTRFKNLWEKRSCSKIDFDKAELSYENSKKDYQMQLSRLERARNQVKLEYQNARNNYNISLEESGNYGLKSRINGFVYKTFKQEGELVNRQEPIAILGEKDKLYIQMSVDELDIKKIKTGQKVLVSLDAYPDSVFNAVVRKIYPMVNPRDQSFRVDAYFTGTVPVGFTGLAAEANIIIREKDQALTIPKYLLKGEDSVEIIENGEQIMVKIRKGLETLEEVEILSGLSKDSQLVKR
jgi:HlyD family secretion protein